MTGKIELSTREAAWLPEMSSVKEPIISVAGYSLTLISFIYLGVALYLTLKAFNAPGNPVVWKFSALGLVYISFAGLFGALAIIPRNGVNREYQIFRAVALILTRPSDILPEPKNDKKKEEKEKKREKKKKPKKEKQKKKKDKKSVKPIKVKWGDANGKE